MRFAEILPSLREGKKVTNDKFLSNRFCYLETDEGDTVIRVADVLGVKETWHGFHIDEILSNDWSCL